MNLKTTCIRFLNMIMVICLVTAMFPVFASSASYSHVDDEDAVLKDNIEIKDIEPDSSITGLKYIDEKTLVKQGASKRLIEKETMNSYVFKNKDGTESVVIFPENIKYINEKGEIVEKDITLVKERSGGYTVKASEYRVVFPEDIGKGISFRYRDGNVSITPKNEKNSGKLIVCENAVLYPDVFGESTALRYTPLLSGIKEDIILDKYTGKDSFTFIIDTENLNLTRNEDGIVFTDGKKETVLNFGDVFAYDSNGNFVKGSLSVDKNYDEKGYLVTVSIGKEFLTDPKTVYPVIIDPTINESSDGSKIQDAPVFNSASYMGTNCGSYIYNSIGATSLGTARTVVRLYGLETHPIFKTLDAEEIISVKLSVRETTGNAAKFVNLYRISEAVSWTESTVNWNNAGSYDETVNKGDWLNPGTRTEFDITSFAKGWKNHSYTDTYRLVFTMSGGENSSLKQFDSSECAQDNKKPYIIFTYQTKNLMEEGTYYIRNKHIDRYLQPANGSMSVDTGMELYEFTGSNAQKWIVTSNGNGFYTIKSAQSDYVLSIPEGSYSTYDVQLIQAADTQADGQQWRIYMTSYCGFAIKPKSACGPDDGTGWSDRTMSVADGNDGNGALVTQRPYVYNNSFKDEWYLVPADISSGDYTIENRQLSKYLCPEGGNAQINNELDLCNSINSNNEKWILTAIGNGYWKIAAKNNSSIVIMVASGSESTENGTIIQAAYSENNNRQQWLIYKVPNGLILKARSSGLNNLVLSVRGEATGNGAVVSQKAYVNNPDYRDEWALHNVTASPSVAVVEDGVYSIFMGAYCCHSWDTRVSEHTNVKLYWYSSGSGQSTLHKALTMWRIHHLGNGYYSIRPLYKLDMGLNANSGNADVITIGTVDISSAIPDSAEWRIEKSGTKYSFINRANPALAITAAGITSVSDVSVSPYSSENTYQQWDLTRIQETEIPKGIFFYACDLGHNTFNITRYIAPEQQLAMNDANGLNLTVAVIDAENIANTPTWHVNPAGVEYLNVDPLTGTIEGIKHKDGVVTVTCETYIGSELFSNDYDVFITHVANGVYFLKNKQNSCYAKVKNETLVDSQNAVQYSYEKSDYERWIFKLNMFTGYYTIQSYASQYSTPYYLQVKNNSSSKDVDVVLNSFTGQNFPDGMLWRFENVDETSYKIIPKTGESPDLIRADYVLATSTSSSSNNDNLKQGKYIGNNGSYRDEWYIVDNNSYIDDVVVSLCSIKSNDRMHEHDKCFLYFDPLNSNAIYNRDLESDFHRAGFKNVLVKSNTSLSYTQAVNIIRNSNVFVIRSHGDAKKVNTSNEVLATYVVLDETNNIKLYSNSDPCFSIDSGSGVLPSNDENDYFSNVDLALFIDCKTAAGAETGNTHNLPAKLVEQGAKTAIGFSQEIVCQQGDLWMKFFLQSFLNGSSVYDSMEVARYLINTAQLHLSLDNEDNYHFSGLCSIAVYGDTSLCVDDIRR